MSTTTTAPLEPLTPASVKILDAQFGAEGTESLLSWAWQRFGARAGIGTSFQGAGLVIMHIAWKNQWQFPVFTLDTGLLFKETVELKKRLEDYFGYAIEAVVPDLTVEQQAEAHGPELWKREPDLCCTVRKVMPLQSRLSDLDAWITGLRRQQSETRSSIGMIELYQNAGRDIVKLNPVANWSREQVWNYIHQHKIPYNHLHDLGYRSIGCSTCTHAASQGENERAGRWTGFDKVECGIHTFMSRKVDFQI